ncbi:MAG TPA: SRPBCC domain-containing protein [Candidatus Acidoferrales bacterium]|nr:SRPBCC domain-containing protein [Candidatus Acidoferrales bacterium]
MIHRSKFANRSDRPTRREAIVAGITGFAGLGLVPARAWGRADDEISHAAESIHQEPEFNSSAKRIYVALIDPKQFDKVVELSGVLQAMHLGNRPSQISPAVGGPFALFGGFITGRQLELVPDKRIVQAWRVGDWPEGIYSIAKFELVPQGTGTKIIFDHTGFPKGDAESLASGWKAHYWKPLTKLLA